MSRQYYTFLQIGALEISKISMYNFLHMIYQRKGVSMSFTGIFKAKDGIFAIADSKGSILSNGKLVEEIGRNPQKLFPFVNGVAVTYGANQIQVQNSNRLFPTKVNVEELVYEYLNQKHTLDSDFFQTFLIKMGTCPANQEPVNFIVGRKIRTKEYRLELHQIGFNYYVERIASDTDYYFTGGEDLYKRAFDQMDFLTQVTSVDVMQKSVASKLEKLITFYDNVLSYNSVGGDIKSYIIR